MKQRGRFNGNISTGCFFYLYVFIIVILFFLFFFHFLSVGMLSYICSSFSCSSSSDSSSCSPFWSPFLRAGRGGGRRGIEGSLFLLWLFSLPFSFFCFLRISRSSKLNRIALNKLPDDLINFKEVSKFLAGFFQDFSDRLGIFWDSSTIL